MVFVRVKLNSSDLQSHMADMRVWLDGNRVETAGFSYRQYSHRAIARLAFPMTSEAKAFATRFAGRVVSESGALSSRE